MRRLVVIGCVALAAGAAPAASATPCPQTLPPGTPLSLPKDDGVHDGPVSEAFTWMGYVHGRGTHPLAIQLDEIDVSPSGRPSLAAIDVKTTDLVTGRFDAVRYDGTQIGDPGPGQFAFEGDGQRASGGNGRDRLHIELGGRTIDVTLTSVGPILADYDNGVWRTDAAQYDLSYDRPLMLATGTVKQDGRTVAVTGFADFGHYWGPSVAGLTVNWDFMEFRLPHGRLLQVWQARPRRGDPVQWATGAVVDAHCHVRHLGLGDFTITPTGTWTRPDGSCSYPMGWRVEVGRRRYVVTPYVRDEELRSPPLTYWRGPARLAGDATGRGFVELVGYCS